MVKITSLLPLFLAPLGLVTANPTAELDRREGYLDDAEATKLLKIYISFFEKIEPKTAEKYLTPDFFEVSASLNFLFGKNVRYTLHLFG